MNYHQWYLVAIEVLGQFQSGIAWLTFNGSSIRVAVRLRCHHCTIIRTNDPYSKPNIGIYHYCQNWPTGQHCYEEINFLGIFKSVAAEGYLI